MRRNNITNIKILTLANFYFKKLFYFSKGHRVYYRVFWSVWMQTPSFQIICSLIILCTPAQMQIKFTGRVQIIEFIFIVSVLPWQLNCSAVWWKYKSVDSQATWQKAGCFLSNVMNQKKCEAQLLRIQRAQDVTQQEVKIALSVFWTCCEKNECFAVFLISFYICICLEVLIWLMWWFS